MTNITETQDEADSDLIDSAAPSHKETYSGATCNTEGHIQRRQGGLHPVTLQLHLHRSRRRRRRSTGGGRVQPARERQPLQNCCTPCCNGKHCTLQDGGPDSELMTPRAAAVATLRCAMSRGKMLRRELQWEMMPLRGFRWKGATPRHMDETVASAQSIHELQAHIYFLATSQKNRIGSVGR